MGARSAVWARGPGLLGAGARRAARLAAPTSLETLYLTARTFAGWMGPQAATDGWQPVFNGAAGQVRASYRSASDDEVVELFHAVYTGKPRRGHDLITYGNDLYDAADSQILSHARRQVDLAGGRGTTAGELRLAGAAGPRLVWYWYCVDLRCTASPVLTKLLQASDVLRGHIPRSSVWALSSPVAGNDLDRARTKLHDFAQTLLAEEPARLPAHRQAEVAGNKP